MRYRLLALLLLWALTVPDPADGLAADDEPPRIRVLAMGKGWQFQPAAEDPADVVTREQLATLVRTFEDHDTLGEVLESIHVQTGVDITVNWPACALVGIDKHTQVAINFVDVPARALLDFALKQASADCFDDDKLGFIVREGVVQVSTLRELKTETETRIYDLGPLVRSRFRPVGLVFEADAHDETIAFHAWRRGQRDYPYSDETLKRFYEQQIQQLRAELEKISEPAPGNADEAQSDAEGPAADPEDFGPTDEPLAMAPRGGGGLFFADDSDPSPLDPDYEEYIDDLIEMIQDTVGDPDEWLDEESTIRERDGLLVVLTTAENHRAVEAQLNAYLQSELDDQAAILRDVHVMELLSRASALQLDGEFADALVLAERALLIDPSHLTARAMHRVLAETVGRMGAGE